MRTPSLLLLLFMCVFYCGNAQQKTMVFRQLTAGDGLSDNQVTCMLRDKNGFMWLGTRDGLSRYDGHDFYNFRHRVNDAASLCSNNITCLAYDNDSILWVGTASSGFCSYDFRTQKFTTYNKNNVALLSNSINDMQFDASRNVLWLALNNGGLQLFSLTKRNILTDNIITPHRTFYDILLKDAAAFAAGIVLSVKKMQVPFVPDSSKSPFGPARTINRMFAGSDGNIWCGAWDNALHEFNDDAELLQSYIFDGTGQLNFSTDEIISIAEDANRILWCGTKNSGLRFFDLTTKTFIHYQLSTPITSRIHCLYRDDYNRMWVGTEEGLFVYDLLQNQFSVTLLPVPGDLINCKVHDRVITENRSEYIVATCGLFYKKKGEQEYHFKTFQYRNEQLQLVSIYQDGDGNILIGTNKTLFILDTLKIELQTVPVNPRLLHTLFFSIYSSRVNSISPLQVANRELIAFSFYGHYLALVDLKRKNIFWLHTEKGKAYAIENLTRKIYIDAENRMWVCGASRGISQFLLPETFNPDQVPVSDTSYTKITLLFQSWENRPGKDSILINDVYDIEENTDGSFWLTSESLGLIKFNPENKEAPFYLVKGNYQSLQGISKQDEGNLWLISSKGLLNYNLNSGSYKLFDSKHGIPQGISGYFFGDDDTLLSAGFDGG
ncbi:MAG TPA: two-component regulator propeller domain-containing protein, partial [Chitinophagales bacterium]|nr:two-component regulator propeller domain-containing protein [Chitinophagales bacterium]